MSRSIDSATPKQKPKSSSIKCLALSPALHEHLRTLMHKAGLSALSLVQVLKLRPSRAGLLRRRRIKQMINKPPPQKPLVSQAKGHKRPSHSPPSYSLQSNTPFPRPDPSRKYSRNCSAAFVPRRETAAPKHQRLRVDERLKLRRLRAAALARRGMMKKDK